MQSRWYILFMLAWLLQGCASSYNAERLQGGKVSFMAGDFKSAFHQLLPLAAENNPQAEYAVGYMYYYGYGVTQDSESGIFWMNKSANAHFMPAIRALALIQEKSLRSEMPRVNSTTANFANPRSLSINKSSDNEYKNEKDAVLATIAPASGAAGQVTIMQEADGILLPQMQNKTALPEQNFLPMAAAAPAVLKYTLQLLGSYYLADIKKSQTRLSMVEPTYIGQTTHNDRNWYVLTYGKYTSISKAALAKFDLPSKIKKFKPWIRKRDELQWVG